MKQVLAITMIVTMAAGQAALLTAQTLGVIEGTVGGNSGPIAGATVNVANSEGVVVRTATTGPAGTFSFGQMPMGKYFILVSGPGGAVISTGVVTLSEDRPMGTVMMGTSGPRYTGGAASAAGSGQLRVAALSAGLSAAASAAAVVAVVRATDDASPSR
jgi:hypothetical protein